MEEGDYGTLEFGATAGVDGGGRKCLPHNGLADIGGNEEGDTTSKTVTFLEQFVEENNDEASHHELHDQQNADTGPKITGLAVETSEDIDAGLAEGNNDGKEFLGGLVQFTVGLEVEVYINEVGSGKELVGDQSDLDWHEIRSIGCSSILSIPGRPFLKR